MITGDNDRVAQKVCADLGLACAARSPAPQLERLDDDALAAALPSTTIFARVTPEQKSRVIKAQRALGVDGRLPRRRGQRRRRAARRRRWHLGETATDVAKDAADIVLLDKDLDILADGVVEGRRIFANTIKYVLMGTSSNFGNMFSAGAASLFLSFLPMLPTQILLNNLLYDISEMTIPTDNVDEEQLLRPAHWDTALIRRFMLFFGPISSMFDFATFGIMIWVFNADATLFRSGWFVESLATQSLVIFAIRTRRVPFFRSRPSMPLTVSTLSCVTIGVLLPFSPLAHVLGFKALPIGFLAALAGMIVIYLVLIELGKLRFYRAVPGRPARLASPRKARTPDSSPRLALDDPQTGALSLSRPAYGRPRRRHGGRGHTGARIHHHRAIRSDHHGIQVELDYLRMSLDERAQPQEDVLEGADGRRRRAAIAVEKREGPERAHHLRRVAVVYRGEPDRHVLQQLGRGAARSAGEERSEVRVVGHADEHLHGRRLDLALDEEPAERMPRALDLVRHLAGRAGHLRAALQPDLHGVGLRLVDERGSNRLQDHASAEAIRGVAGALRVGGGHRLHQWDPVRLEHVGELRRFKPAGLASQGRGDRGRRSLRAHVGELGHVQVPSLTPRAVVDGMSQGPSGLLGEVEHRHGGGPLELARAAPRRRR